MNSNYLENRLIPFNNLVYVLSNTLICTVYLHLDQLVVGVQLPDTLISIWIQFYQSYPPHQRLLLTMVMVMIMIPDLTVYWWLASKFAPFLPNLAPFLGEFFLPNFWALGMVLRLRMVTTYLLKARDGHQMSA